MFLAFGVLALILAAMGLYSVIAYNVTQRTHEIGVRVALGAQARDVAGLVVSDGLRVTIVGVAIGGAVALWAGRWVKALLFDVSPNDPAVFALVAATLVAAGVAASWLPARRATRVDPNVVLRADCRTGDPGVLAVPAVLFLVSTAEGFHDHDVSTLHWTRCRDAGTAPS